MKFLFFDIASHIASIACCTDKDTLSYHKCDSHIGDDELLPLIEEALDSAKWQYEDITSIACVIGPGGFTGLRVSVACANTLAHQLNIPAAGVHLSDYYHARTKEEDVIWLHSTKKQEIFARGFGKFSTQWLEPTHLSLDECINNIPVGSHWMGELIDEHVVAISDKNLQKASLQDPVIILPSFLSSLSYKEEILLPWYGRGY